MTPVSLLYAYFCIGFCAAFPGLGVSYILVNELGFTASDVANTALLCSAPWCVKPLWAFVSDKCSVCGYRRRPYVCALSLVASALMFATPHYAVVGSETSFVGALVCTSLCLCVVDVAVDGSVMVLVGQEAGSQEGSAQTHSWIARVGGGAMAAGWSGYIYETFGFETQMGICAALPFVLSFVALDIPDTPLAAAVPVRGNSKESCATPVAVLQSLWSCRYALAAAVLVSLVPEINTSLFFYLLSAHATPKEMSLVDVSGSLASLLTLLLYNACRPRHRASFFWGVVLNALAAAVGCFMANDAVTPLLQGAAFQAALSAVGSALVLMPTVTVLGKAAASSRTEATSYSCALSVLNLASVASESVAAAAMRQLHVTKGDVNNVRVFVGAVSVLTLLAAPSAWMFPGKTNPGEVVDVDEEQTGLLGGDAELEMPAFVLEMSDSEDDANRTEKEDGETGQSYEDGAETQQFPAV